MSELRKTGIEVLGDIPWGSHLCQFYETKQDLLDLLIPYFKTGLENNEFCLWVTSNPLTQENVMHALKKVIPGFEDFQSRQSIEILSHNDWYLKKGKFNPKDIITGWNEKLKTALEKGYDGMRVNGNESWLEPEDWEDFMNYERELNKTLHGLRMIVLCTYPLKKSNAAAILDVAHAHERVISKRKGHWEILEDPEINKMKVDLMRMNEELEQRVAKRTRELEASNKELAREIAEHRKSELRLISEKELSTEIIDSIPGVFELYNQDFRFLRWNKLFEITSGYSPDEIRNLHVVNDLCFGAEREKKYEILKKINENGRYEGEISLTTKSGKLIPVHFVGQLINYEGESCFICTAIDITERKRIEQELKRSELRYRTLVEQASDAIIITDEKGKLTEMNTSFCKMFGYSENELIGMNMTELADPDQLKNDPLRIDLLLAGKTIFRERRMKKKDGTIFETEANVQMLPDKRILAIVRDITQRKKAEEKLRQSENLLAEAEQIAHIGSWSLDLHSNTVTWSDELYLMFGVKKSEFDHKLESVFGFIHSDDRDNVKQIVEEAIKTQEPYNFYFHMMRPDGEMRIIHARGAVMTDEQGNAVRMVGASQDVTERKQAEDELQLAYQRLSYHVENTPLAVIEWDKNLNITKWSEQAEKIFGWKASEVLGRNRYDPDFAIVYKEDEEKVAKVDYELMNGLVNRNLSLNRNYTKDGKVIHCEWYNSVLRDEHGNIITILSLTHDVTERKKAEDALRKSEDHLRLVIDTIPTMVWTVRPDGVVDFLNQRWLDYSGLSLEEYTKDPMGPIHPEDIPGVMEKWRQSMTTEKPHEDEMRLRRADGEYRWFLVRTEPLRDERGNLVKWYGVSIDIEDSKRAEDALKKSEQRYLSLFENMAEGVAYFQMLFKNDKLYDAIYLEVNPAWENLTGLRNVIGRKITEVIPGILEAKSEFFDRSVRVAVTGQSERFEVYSPFLKKWLSVSAYCPRKEHVIVVFDDITKRKKAEETLQQSYEEIRRLTEHLQNIREEERKTIAREIHDELGTQLTVLKMDISWLNKRLVSTDNSVKEKLSDLLGILDNTVQSVRRISYDLRPHLLDSLGLTAAMDWHLKEFEKRSAIKTKFRIDAGELYLPDEIKTGLFRIFQESLTNVARHSEASQITVDLILREGKLILKIEDDGKGFELQKISEKQTLGILGMKERATMMGGNYEINSEPGKGTIIAVVLPFKIETLNKI